MYIHAYRDEAFVSAGYSPDTITAYIADEGRDAYDLSGCYNKEYTTHYIHWVNRDRRSYSVGQRIIDPRTGQILQGHVRIESLRFRQDALIIQALLTPFSTRDTINRSVYEGIIQQRCKLLIAHEVGHTLGLTHNFAGSTYSPSDTASTTATSTTAADFNPVAGAAVLGSVMDYPPPLVTVNHTDGSIILSSHAYSADHIGYYDKTAIEYAYRVFPNTTISSEFTLLCELISDAELAGYVIVTDEDAAPDGADWRGTKWDSGNDPIQALNHSILVRNIVLTQWNNASSNIESDFRLESKVPFGYPLSLLRELFPIVYFWHR